MWFVRLDRLYHINEGTCPKCELIVHVGEEKCPHCLYDLSQFDIENINVQAQKYQRSIRNAAIFGGVLFIALVVAGLVNTFIT